MDGCTHACSDFNSLQDYQLTKEQVDEYKKVFDLLDKDKNGTISTSELGDAMRFAGLEISEDLLKEFIESVDTDNSGTLSFAEFQTLIIREVQRIDIKELREIFRSFDTDNDGSITVEEAQIGLKKQGVKADTIEKCIKQLFLEKDFDKDNKISFEG